MGDTAVAEHATILAAFERGDPNAARLAMLTHMHNVKGRAHADREAVSELS